MTNPGDAIFRTAGQTLWAWQGDEGQVGLAWDWVQITRGVVAMADPMAVVTNLRLVGEEGEVLTALESARHINYIVHALPWQHEVELALGGGAAPVFGPLRAEAPQAVARRPLADGGDELAASHALAREHSTLLPGSTLTQ